MEESVCLEGCFFSQDQDGNCRHIPLTVCSVCPGGRWACSDLVACVRGGVEAGISSLPSLPPAFPGITPEPFASLSHFQVLFAVKGTCWISPTSNLIQFDTGGSGLESD